MLELRLQARFAVYLCLSLITKLKGSANTDRHVLFSVCHTQHEGSQVSHLEQLQQLSLVPHLVAVRITDTCVLKNQRCRNYYSI